MNRLQHFVSAGAIAAVGVWVYAASFTQQPADAFLFPRLISVAFYLLSLTMIFQVILGGANPGEGLSREQVANLLPGFAVTLAYVFWAAEALGFYAATAIAFFIVLSLYDPGSHAKPGVWARRFLVTAGFIAAIYGLFTLMLKVHPPKGIFF